MVFRLPLGRNFDIVAGHSQSMREGYDQSVREAPYVKIKGTEYGVGLTGHFLPRQAADPYLEAGVSNVTTSTTLDGRPTYADEDIKFRLGAGQGRLWLLRNAEACPPARGRAKSASR